jgi:hypothetical protein
MPEADDYGIGRTLSLMSGIVLPDLALTRVKRHQKLTPSDM